MRRPIFLVEELVSDMMGRAIGILAMGQSVLCKLGDSLKRLSEESVGGCKKRNSLRVMNFSSFRYCSSCLT